MSVLFAKNNIKFCATIPFCDIYLGPSEMVAKG